MCFAEVLGTGPIARGAVPRLLKSLYDLEPDDRLSFGIAPHAPYSTAEDVYRRAVLLAHDRDWLVTTHLAEAEGEDSSCSRGRASSSTSWPTSDCSAVRFGAHGCKPVEFAQRVGLFNGPCLLAHVNYIDDEELKLLARSDVSVAYCPGSSDFFGRRGHRYPEMLAAGINVAIGTDSLASNASLEMVEEMRRLRRAARVDNHTILQMATLHGARHCAGEEPGKPHARQAGRLDRRRPARRRPRPARSDPHHRRQGGRSQHRRRNRIPRGFLSQTGQGLADATRARESPSHREGIDVALGVAP